MMASSVKKEQNDGGGLQKKEEKDDVPAATTPSVAAPSATPSPPDLYVVAVDTKGAMGSFMGPRQSDINGYKEMKCAAAYFQKNIVDDPAIVCIQCTTAELCGLDMKVYFKKHKKSPGKIRKETGSDDAAMHYQMSNPALFRKNNLAAYHLVTDMQCPPRPESDYIIEGKAYVVVDDGRYPLSKGQVWGLVEFIQLASENFVDQSGRDTNSHGHQQLTKLVAQYRGKKFVIPPTTSSITGYRPASTASGGVVGVDIYAPRATPTAAAAAAIASKK